MKNTRQRNEKRGEKERERFTHSFHRDMKKYNTLKMKGE
jgi:hypothetical protein